MTRWATAICKTNGINLHYTRTGAGRSPLVLLHGLTGNGTCWTDLARALQVKYDVIMPDARGHGKSSVPDHGYRYEDHASDVIGLIKALKLSPPVLLGHSMGGMTATMVAAHNPGLLCGLILVDPTFLSPEVQWQVADSDVADQHRQILKQSLAEVITEAQKRHPHRSADMLERIARARLQTSLEAFDVLTPPDPDYMRLVSAVDVPSLLVIGDAGVVSATVAAELQHVNSRLQVEQIREAGHGLHYDQPERFTAVVQSFLGRLA